MVSEAPSRPKTLCLKASFLYFMPGSTLQASVMGDRPQISGPFSGITVSFCEKCQEPYQMWGKQNMAKT